MKKRKTVPESVSDKGKPGEKPGKKVDVEPTVKNDLAKIKKPKGKLAKISHPSK